MAVTPIAPTVPKARGLLPRNGLWIVLIIIAAIAFLVVLNREDPADSALHPVEQAAERQAAAVAEAPAARDTDIDESIKRAQEEKQAADRREKERLAQEAATKALGGPARSPTGIPAPIGGLPGGPLPGPLPGAMPGMPPMGATPLPGGVPTAGAGQGAVDDRVLAASQRESEIANSPLLSFDKSGDERRAALSPARDENDPLVRMERQAQEALRRAEQSGSGGAGGMDQAAKMMEAMAKQAGGQGAPASDDAQGRAWMKEYGSQATGALEMPTPPAAKYMVQQGTQIPAVTERATDSTLPGEVTARVSADVYDSLGRDMQNPLIPMGSRLVGRYSSDIRPGQERVLFAWSRLILPDGTSYNLNGGGGTDQMGRAGITGKVNNHFWQQFGSALMIAVVGDWLGGQGDSGGGGVIIAPGGAGGSVGRATTEVTRSILQRNRNIPPTITTEGGERINVEVTRDMPFSRPTRSLFR